MLHCLKSVAKLGPAQARASGRDAVAALKALPTGDVVFGIGRVRQDGQKLHPAYSFQVKLPAAGKYPWDDYTLVSTTPLEDAFGPMHQGGCELVAKL